MKNGSLGNDDLFASMQSRDEGPNKELLHVAEAEVNSHAVPEVAKTKDATSHSGNTFEEEKAYIRNDPYTTREIGREKWFTETDAEKQEQNHNNSKQKKNVIDPAQVGQKRDR